MRRTASRNFANRNHILLAFALPSHWLAAPSARITNAPPLTLRKHFAARQPSAATAASFGDQKWPDVFQDPELQKLIRDSA